MEKEKYSYHHGNLRESITENAMKQLNNGIRIQDISIRKISEELNVSRGAPYRHFATHDALIAEVATMGFKMLIKQYSISIQDNKNDPPTKAIGKAHLRFAINNPCLYDAMFYFPSNDLQKYPHLMKVANESYNFLMNSIKGSNSDSNSSDKSAEVIGAWSLVHGLADLVNKQIVPLDIGKDSVVLDKLMSFFGKI